MNSFFSRCSYVVEKSYSYIRFSKMSVNSKKLFLFDVDGTLTLPRKKIEAEMLNFLLNDVKSKHTLGLVGGSDLEKISEQMGGHKVLEEFDYVFSENGLIAHTRGKEVFRKSIQDEIGEEQLQKFINYTLRCLGNITLPVKRGNFIEFRTGLINVCPVGRSCSQQERDQFGEYDKVHKIRENIVQNLTKEFPNLGLVFAIGGQISIDVFPKGWDKTYCLNHIDFNNFSEIHFFGDKTDKGGNDYEIYNDSRTIGHRVTSPADTKEQVTKFLK